MPSRSLLICLVLAPFTLTAGLAAAFDVEFSDPGFVSEAGMVPVGARLRVEGVELPGRPGRAALELKRFEIFAPDARIVVHGADGEEFLAVPDTRYFRGYVDGLQASTAYLSIQADGEARGIIGDAGRYWILGNFDGQRRLPQLVIRDVPDNALAQDQSEFSCGTGGLATEPGAALRGLISTATPRPALGATTHTARVAIETDNEFLNLFSGNTADATEYTGDLLGFSSAIYAAEVDTDFYISFISLWTVTDPWAETNPTCGLFEFGRDWNDNYGGTAGGDVYTLSHFMSGKNNGGGVAWVGVLCSGAFNYNHGGACGGLSPQTDNYGGPYGYSGDMDGNFNVDNPSVVWDIFVVSHEIGHNFDSPHTHCYAGLQGNPNDIDHCYGQQSGCYAGATSLPSGCPGGGQGCGTIMSYCHLLGPGISNISLTLGTGHPYGIAPERVPSQISDHVLATAGAAPACLAPVATLFADGFESGDSSQWDSTVP